MVLVLCISAGFASGQADEAPAPALPLEGMHVGVVAWDRCPYGNFLYYVPVPGPPVGMLVLVHGSFSESDDATETAKWYTEAFVQAAQRRNLVIVTPCFDDPNFGLESKRPLGGYRRLEGRVVGADRFLESCVDRMIATFPNLDGKFYLCGESSGGQFVSRYLVKHPDRVRGAVICRSQSYAFPSTDVRWPEGMARLQTMVRWNKDGAYTELDYTPDPKAWVKVTELPVTVVVGALDTKPMKAVTGIPGLSVVERAKNYVHAMNEYARKQGAEGRMKLVAVNNVGLKSLDLIPACILALFANEE